MSKEAAGVTPKEWIERLWGLRHNFAVFFLTFRFGIVFLKNRRRKSEFRFGAGLCLSVVLLEARRAERGIHYRVFAVAPLLQEDVGTRTSGLAGSWFTSRTFVVSAANRFSQMKRIWS